MQMLVRFTSFLLAMVQRLEPLPVSFEGEELKHPETGETLMIHTYSQVVLNQKEMDIIHAHTQG